MNDKIGVLIGIALIAFSILLIIKGNIFLGAYATIAGTTAIFPKFAVVALEYIIDIIFKAPSKKIRIIKSSALCGIGLGTFLIWHSLSHLSNYEMEFCISAGLVLLVAAVLMLIFSHRLGKLYQEDKSAGNKKSEEQKKWWDKFSQTKEETNQSKENLSADELLAYKILGVNPEDSDDTIKKAYQKLKKIYSVSNNSYKNTRRKQYGPEKNNDENWSNLTNVNWAWDIIKKTRKIYQSNSNATNKAMETEYKYSLLVLYSMVMKADGKQMVCELEIVKNTIRRHFKTEEKQTEALKTFKSILNIELNVEVVYQTVNRRLNELAKSELIMELLALSYADDHFSSYEESVIKEIAKNLNIKDEKYKSILAIFKKKYESKKYKADNEKNQSKRKNKNDDSKKQEKSNNSNYSNNKSNTQSRNRISVNEAYDILGVSGNFSDAELKKAYHAMAMKYHPDNAANLGEETIRQATETMKQINVAWDTVKMARGIK